MWTKSLTVQFFIRFCHQSNVLYNRDLAEKQIELNVFLEPTKFI